ncbi:hypothetical protein D3C73_1466220 [compost metagenome]
MHGSLVDQRCPDLIGEHPSAIALHDIRDIDELLTAEHAADRVVGVAEDQQIAALVEGALEGVEVELVASVGHGQRHLDDLASSHRRDHEERHVRRSRHDDL